MTAPDPGTDPFLSPPLDAEQLALLSRYGQERPTTAGQVLFREGDRGYDFIVVLSGSVSVVDHEDGVMRDFGQGSLRRTDAPLDLAIEGQGFFQVQSPNGPRYTRDGNFRLDEYTAPCTRPQPPCLCAWPFLVRSR